MIIDSINLNDLPDESEEAFVAFEERLRDILKIEEDQDQKMYRDENGYYAGSYYPQRYYVSSIIAFLDEYNIDMDIEDISSKDNPEFLTYYTEFFNRINYARTRFKLRKKRTLSGQAGTPILINPNFREQIHNLLATIKKIVNAHIQDINKKERIYKKIVGLQSEIDRERTTIDAVFSRAIDISRVIGECAENMEPLVQKVERLFRVLSDAANPLPLLPKKERAKLLPKSDAHSDDLEDDIPF